MRERDKSDQGIAHNSIQKFALETKSSAKCGVAMVAGCVFFLCCDSPDRTWHASVCVSPNSQSQTPEERHRSLDPLDLCHRSSKVIGSCWLCGTGQDHCPKHLHIHMYILYMTFINLIHI